MSQEIILSSVTSYPFKITDDNGETVIINSADDMRRFMKTKEPVETVVEKYQIDSKCIDKFGNKDDDCQHCVAYCLCLKEGFAASFKYEIIKDCKIDMNGILEAISSIPYNDETYNKLEELAEIIVSNIPLNQIDDDEIEEMIDEGYDKILANPTINERFFDTIEERVSDDSSGPICALCENPSLFKFPEKIHSLIDNVEELADELDDKGARRRPFYIQESLLDNKAINDPQHAKLKVKIEKMNKKRKFY